MISGWRKIRMSIDTPAATANTALSCKKIVDSITYYCAMMLMFFANNGNVTNRGQFCLFLRNEVKQDRHKLLTLG